LHWLNNERKQKEEKENKLNQNAIKSTTAKRNQTKPEEEENKSHC
jgi:hypothetical protein